MGEEQQDEEKQSDGGLPGLYGVRLAAPEEGEAFSAALVQLAKVFASYKARVGVAPILVGGASVMLFTDYSIFSRDFDLLAGDDDTLGMCMAEHGFRREDRRGFLRFGWYHPDHPGFGVQQVSGRLFDGHTDETRLISVELEGDLAVTLPPLEDLIADRLGQHAVAGPGDDSRLWQARWMLTMARNIDREYMRRRVREEGGNLALLDGYYPGEQIRSLGRAELAAEPSAFLDRMDDEAASSTEPKPCRP